MIFRVGTRASSVCPRIPAIDLSVPLTELGLNPDDTVEVPADFQQAGWYQLELSPGQTGAAVILGHVDSYRGPAVFSGYGPCVRASRSASAWPAASSLDSSSPRLIRRSPRR